MQELFAGYLDLAVRYLKHSCPDGDYTLEGPEVGMIFYRISGIVYPAGGTIKGKKITPRSREECVATFGTDPQWPF